MVRFINHCGDHYSMGWQHGRQVRDLRSRIQVAMDHRLSQLEKLEAGVQPYVDEFEAGLQGTALYINHDEGNSWWIVLRLGKIY